MNYPPVTPAGCSVGITGLHPVALTAGTRLGPYEVLAPLGAGGMGEVYRARDTRLGRSAAIKVLPEALSAETGRLRRFEKESRAASSLNHPNIVTIYDVGTMDSRAYIAMELVEGKTLRELLNTGPVPLRRLLSLTAQIADGLATAHEAGIVHRDLKPENVMMTKDGFAKILDFGLAKLTHAGEDAAAESRLPTLTRGTEPGVVMGTAGYMSPEQASGRALDFRSDQFSFGSILYEMVTGKTAFLRSTAAETLAAIIREEPEQLGSTTPSVPVPLRWIVERCLAKEPQERYASTRDLARDLARLKDGLAEASGSGPSLAAAPPRPILRRWPVAAVLGLLIGVGIGVFTVHRPPERPPVYRSVSSRRGAITSSRFAPDGQTILYTASFQGEEARIFSTRLGSPEWGPLPLPAASLVSISDSGKLLMALTRGETQTLAEVPLAGGAPREIFEGPAKGDAFVRADFAPGGESLAVIAVAGDRDRLEFPMGKVLYDPKPGVGLRNPRFSPNGDRIAFFEEEAGDYSSSVAVVDRMGKKTTLSRNWGDAINLAWNPKTGEVWFSARETGASSGALILHAVSPSGRQRVVLGGPGIVVVDDISREGRVLLKRVDLASNMICLPPGATKEVDLSWFDFAEVADMSADGKTLLFVERGSGEAYGGAVYIRKTDGSPPVRLGEGYANSLSPDGKWAAVVPLTSPDRLVLLPTGAGQPKTLLSQGLVHAYYGATWLPDGKRILFSASRSGHGTALFVQDLDGGSPRPVTPEDIGDSLFTVSPDGKLVAAHGRGEKAFLYPIDGGQPRAVPEIKPSDELIRWDERGETLFLADRKKPPVRIDRLVLSSGRREPWKELMPADLSGLFGVSEVHLTPDGESYAFTCYRQLARLYVVEGLK